MYPVANTVFLPKYISGATIDQATHVRIPTEIPKILDMLNWFYLVWKSLPQTLSPHQQDSSNKGK